MPRTLLTTASSAGTAALLLFAVSACGGGGTSAGTTPTTGAQQNQSAWPAVRWVRRRARLPRCVRQGCGDLGQDAAGAEHRERSGRRDLHGEDDVHRGGEDNGDRGQGRQLRECAQPESRPAPRQQPDRSRPLRCRCLRPSTVRAAHAGAPARAVVRRSRWRVHPAERRAERSARVGAGAGGGTRGGGFAGARPVSGEVTAVKGSTITVGGDELCWGARGERDSCSPSAKPTTTPVVVTTTAATTYTKTVSASANDLAVGQCVTAVGTADDTGAVTASFIASEPAVNGECTRRLRWPADRHRCGWHLVRPGWFRRLGCSPGCGRRDRRGRRARRWCGGLVGDRGIRCSVLSLGDGDAWLGAADPDRDGDGHAPSPGRPVVRRGRHGPRCGCRSRRPCRHRRHTRDAGPDGAA